MKSALLCLVLLTAQAASPEVEITSEPHHHFTFENKSVRVFNVEIPSHDETLMHWHRHDYFSITLGGAEIVNAVKDKPPATLKLLDGDVRFASATFAHIAKVTGDQPFRNVTIELLEDESLRNSTPKWDQDRGLEVLPGGTQQILFVKDNVRVTEFELQPGAAAPMHRTGPHLLVAVSDLDLREDASRNDVKQTVKDPLPNSDSLPGHLKSGDSRWFPGKNPHTITNVGKAPAKFVTLEFP